MKVAGVAAVTGAGAAPAAAALGAYATLPP
jgi:hypothetical protein